MGPDLDIVIVAYNSIDVIGDLLDSIPAADGDLTYDLVVVDNGSTDGTPEFPGRPGRLPCRLFRDFGYAGGINRGVRAAEPAEAILILNPDVRLQEKSLPPLAAALWMPRWVSSRPRSVPRQGPWRRSLPGASQARPAHWG